MIGVVGPKLASLWDRLRFLPQDCSSSPSRVRLERLSKSISSPPCRSRMLMKLFQFYGEQALEAGLYHRDLESEI